MLNSSIIYYIYKNGALTSTYTKNYILENLISVSYPGILNVCIKETFLNFKLY